MGPWGGRRDDGGRRGDGWALRGGNAEHVAERAQDARRGGGGGEEGRGFGLGEEGFEAQRVGDGFVAEFGDEPAFGGGEARGGGAAAARARRARGAAFGEAIGQAGEAAGGAGEAGPEQEDEADAARIAQEGVRDEGGEGEQDGSQALRDC